MIDRRFPNFFPLFVRRPQAWAQVAGSGTYPDVTGLVRFYQTDHGVVVIAEIGGLPNTKEACKSPIFGFHIHEGEACEGSAEDAFADTKGHYDPQNCPHPYHAGDLPPLFGANGYAFSAFLTNRFTVKEIVGKTIVVHGSLDDFTSQPSGNSGVKIACGEIMGYM